MAQSCIWECYMGLTNECKQQNERNHKRIWYNVCGAFNKFPDIFGTGI